MGSQSVREGDGNGECALIAAARYPGECGCSLRVAAWVPELSPFVLLTIHANEHPFHPPDRILHSLRRGQNSTDSHLDIDIDFHSDIGSCAEVYSQRLGPRALQNQ